MKFLLTAINAKYIHSNPGVYSLKMFAESQGAAEPVRFTRFPRIFARSEFMRSTINSQEITPSFSNGISCRTK